jgi:hypothetical protein
VPSPKKKEKVVHGSSASGGRRGGSLWAKALSTLISALDVLNGQSNRRVITIKALTCAGFRAGSYAPTGRIKSNRRFEMTTRDG